MAWAAVGAGAAPDIDEPVETTQWHSFLDKSQNTLRTLADETGGLAIANGRVRDEHSAGERYSSKLQHRAPLKVPSVSSGP